jgi:hypothetical protein
MNADKTNCPGGIPFACDSSDPPGNSPLTKRRLAEMPLLHDGKPDEAIARFDEALQLDPASEGARREREQAMKK